MMLEPKHKRFILSLVILAVIAGVVTFVYEKKYEAPGDEKENVNVNRLPDFAMGKVTKIENNFVYIKGGYQSGPEEELAGKVTPQTEIIQQTKINGLITTAKVSMNEVKVGQNVVMYYANRNENSFDINKLQIVD